MLWESLRSQCRPLLPLFGWYRGLTSECLHSSGFPKFRQLLPPSRDRSAALTMFPLPWTPGRNRRSAQTPLRYQLKYGLKNVLIFLVIAAVLITGSGLCCACQRAPARAESDSRNFRVFLIDQDFFQTFWNKSLNPKALNHLSEL